MTARAERRPPGAEVADVVELTTEEQVAALLHPVRRRILAALAEPASPAEVARKLEIAPQVANYHVRALEAAGLAHEVETVQKRNLLEHRFRAIARSFTLSTALPLTDRQRRQLQSDVALQQLVAAGDAIRRDALRLLETPAEGKVAVAGAHAAAALEIEVQLADGADRAVFVRAVTEAIRLAAAPYQRRGDERTGEGTRYRLHLAIYPVPEGAQAATTAAPAGTAGTAGTAGPAEPAARSIRPNRRPRPRPRGEETVSD
ncbi:MAG: helix-turn-helix transcriptional regulator [Chloroflexi bacterium]|nr:helix-turn-helix transcriptional regulator [Chloroflexota bacterium]